VHSTAFRPIKEEALRRNPFASSPHCSAWTDRGYRTAAGGRAILARRNILTQRCRELLGVFETKGGLDEAGARICLRGDRDFRWRSEAAVSAAVYYKLHKAHPLIADVVCFMGRTSTI